MIGAHGIDRHDRFFAFEFFCQLLKNLKDLPAGTEGFADTAADAWYFEAISALKDKMPAEMIGEGNTIMPTQAITREEAVYLMSAVTKYISDVKTDCTTYVDGADVSAWAVNAMNRLSITVLSREAATEN